MSEEIIKNEKNSFGGCFILEHRVQNFQTKRYHKPQKMHFAQDNLHILKFYFITKSFKYKVIKLLQQNVCKIFYNKKETKTKHKFCSSY